MKNDHIKGKKQKPDMAPPLFILFLDTIKLRGYWCPTYFLLMPSREELFQSLLPLTCRSSYIPFFFVLLRREVKNGILLLHLLRISQEEKRKRRRVNLKERSCKEARTPVLSDLLIKISPGRYLKRSDTCAISKNLEQIHEFQIMVKIYLC